MEWKAGNASIRAHLFGTGFELTVVCASHSDFFNVLMTRGVTFSRLHNKFLATPANRRYGVIVDFM